MKIEITEELALVLSIIIVIGGTLVLNMIVQGFIG